MSSRGLDLVLLSVGQACVWATIFLSVFLGPFAVREMTGTFALGGLPFAMYYLSNLLVVMPAGRLMDRIGRPSVLALGHGTGAAGATAVAISLASVASGGSLAMVGFLVGLFLMSAGASIALLTRVAVADLFPPEVRGRGLSRVLMISFAGTALGAASFSLLAIRGDVPVISGYLAMLPISAVGVIAMVALRRRNVHTRIRSEDPTARLGALVRRPGVGWTVAGNAGAQAGMGGVMSFASAALMPLGSLASGGIMLGHFAGMFLPSPVAGHVADRRSRALAILCGGVVLAAGAMLFSRTDLVWLAGIGLFCVGAGWCFTFIPGTAILADSTTLQERGTLIGTNDAVASVFGATVTVAAGIAYSAWGAAGISILGAACALLPLAAGAALQRNGLPHPLPAVADR